MKASLRGVFLTSDNPAATAAFYQNVADLPLEEIRASTGYRYWKIDQDGMQLAIHGAQPFAEYAYPVVAESNLTHLYFKIDDQERFLAHLGRLGITPHAVDAVAVTVVDTDGRKVMFGTA